MSVSLFIGGDGVQFNHCRLVHLGTLYPGPVQTCLLYNRQYIYQPAGGSPSTEGPSSSINILTFMFIT